VTTSSHTDESESKPSHAAKGIFMPGALPAATVPISGPETGSEYAGLQCSKKKKKTKASLPTF